jgi:replicative DNA helicase
MKQKNKDKESKKELKAQLIKTIADAVNITGAKVADEKKVKKAIKSAGKDIAKAIIKLQKQERKKLKKAAETKGKGAKSKSTAPKKLIVKPLAAKAVVKRPKKGE